MRCPSCEPLLDAYLEGLLSARQTSAVTKHLAGCADCRALLEELRVVDALLTTARTRGDVPPDFTQSVISAARKAPALPRRVPLWVALALYLSIAWLLAVAQLRSHGAAALLAALSGTQRGSLAAIGAAIHAIAPVTPIAAAAVTVILVIDLLLLAMLVFGYRHVRPRIAYHLAKGEPKP